MITLVCKNCASSTTVQAGAEAEMCPRCGRPLRGPVADHAVRPSEAGADDDVTAAATDAVEKSLIADLREAFGLEGGVLQSSAAGATAGAQPFTDVLGPLLGTSTLCAGTRLGDFEILAELGRGGMGIVYRARQVSLDRQIALKVLPGYARHGRLAVQRFRAEAQAAARLHHTNIVAVYAQGEYDGHFYYAMELVDGVSLDVVIRSRPDLLSTTRIRSASGAARLGSGPIPGSTSPSAVAGRVPVDAPDEPAAAPGAVVTWTRADYRHLASLVADVADALHCAHQHGVIHRDVKPHNLLLGANNRLHLTDFGLARLTDEPHLTSSGEIMGTPAYLSPEQIRADIGQIDHRTDIYSLGVTLYELLTRHKPFDGQTREQIITGICTTEPLAPRRLAAHVPVDLETICLRAIEKDPPRRYATAALLAEDLRRFADGRPILARRTSRAEKAAKWVRRHKALTAALAATAAVVILSAGWAWTAGAAHHREAQQLLERAYEQLVYIDYRTPEVVSGDVDRAEALGADAADLHRVRGLASLGKNDQAAAVRNLEAVLQRDPTDVRTRYLLAWARRRGLDFAGAQAALAEADRYGPPLTADAWFFRGLAEHFDEPLTAIECYRQASALRAREHAFFPQAVLHLARAWNQQLYATRRPEPFRDAEASLRLLQEQNVYGAYPYYLLSIANRLLAEIYTDEMTDAQLAAAHYAQALEWARAGQVRDPGDERAVTAEAETLESLGRYAEAIAARSRALELAETGLQRWEGCYYRWRLYYWIGDPQSALRDVAACAAHDPNDRFYKHVYPALLRAELGDLPGALEHARALADETPASAQSVLWSATCLRLLGQPDEARALLAQRADTVDFAADLIPPQSEGWVRALYAYCQQGGALTAVDALAEATAAPRKLWAEAHFHAGALRLSEGDRAGAEEDFLRAYRSFDSEQRYTYQARLILGKLNADSAWPPWVAGVSWNALRDARQGGVAP